MFETARYVPILKCKRGEKKALEQLAAGVKAAIVPLVEIVELKGDKQLQDHLNTSLRDLDRALPPGVDFFLDPHEVSARRPEAAAAIFGAATTAGLTFVPVTGVTRTHQEKVAALRFAARGVCLRIKRKELEQGRVARGLVGLTREFAIDPANSDLLMDMGPIENMVVPGVVAMIRDFVLSVPEMKSWRRVILSGSAFPRSMGILGPDQYGHVTRTEWVVWRDEILGKAHRGDRIPIFSDCAIQHPQGVEGFDPRLMPVSAAIRYTEGDRWLLVKGRSTRSVLPGVQFPRVSRQI